MSEGYAPVTGVIYDARLSAVDADERDSTENARRLKPLCQFLFDPQPIHQGQNSSLASHARADERFRRVDRRRFQRTNDQIGHTYFARIAISMCFQMKIAVAT